MTFLTYAFAHQPGVAVLDILMPAMNGLEVQRRLRHVSPSTRVINLSSKDDPIVRATAMREGASDFFIKGIENEGFLAGIESALDKNGHEAGDTSEEISPITAIQSATSDT
jgi:FixJ family two-component response regulator